MSDSRRIPAGSIAGQFREPLRTTMPTVAEVRAAVEAAPTVDVKGRTLPGATSSDSTPHGATGREFSTVQVETSGPNVVNVSTPDQLREAVRLYGQVSSGMGYAWDPQFWEEQVKHELEHAEVARAVGAEWIVYRLKVVRVTNGSQDQLGMQVFEAHHLPNASNLMLAAIAAGPTTLSDGDLDVIRRLRFRGVEDVATQIALHNRTSSKPIPLPKSVLGGRPPHFAQAQGVVR